VVFGAVWIPELPNLGDVWHQLFDESFDTDPNILV